MRRVPGQRPRRTGPAEDFGRAAVAARVDGLAAGVGVTGVRAVGTETAAVGPAGPCADGPRALLERIAPQAPLHEALDALARAMEELSPRDVAVCVLLADREGRRLLHGAAPSLPDFYRRALDGIGIGEDSGSCGTAAHRREPVAAADIATDPLWERLRGPARRAGLAACWSTPVLGRDGALLGTVALYHRTPGLPRTADVALARLFADTVALAVEREHAETARLAAESRERAAREDLAFLLQASSALTVDLDAVQTLERLAASCASRLAPLCAVDVVENGRLRRVATAAPDDRGRELLAAYTPVYDPDDDAVTRVLATRATEIARRAPTGPGPWQGLGVTGYLCVPLLDRGTAFGTVTLLATEEEPFDGHRVALAEELARRAASAARNARQYTHRVTLARDLQAGLLMPELPDVPGADVATSYHPAGEGLDIGGDFYDVFPLDDGRWAFLLGDVCGRGAIAATTTALVRHTARAVAPLLPGPEDVVAAVNRALVNRPGSHGTGFVTLVYGCLTPTGHGLDVELVRAGHTLPLHLDARRTTRLVDAPGSLLGISAGTDAVARTLRLAPHESLVLYTDGITEARDGSGEQFGEERLAAAVAATAPRPSAQRIVDALTQAVRDFTGGHEIDDDRAVLVLTAT